MASATSDQEEAAPARIRKYSSRRLYDTTSGAFVTLDDLRRMVIESRPFVVEDAKSGADITASVLAQIIAEQAGRGEHLLPGDLMRRLITFYDSGMSENFFNYLQLSMDAFNKNWQQFEPYSEFSKRNAELMRDTFKAFFGNMDMGAGATRRTEAETGADEDTDGKNELKAEIDALRKKLDEMQAQLKD